MNTLAATVVTIASMVGLAHARASYQAKIPNGDKVVDSQNDPWPGVGHFRQSGGGNRNQFGEDFQAAGFQWTEEFCKQDSDCDGLSNGEELGDPNCEWTEGAVPQFTVGITHPAFGDTSTQTLLDSCKDHVDEGTDETLKLRIASHTVTTTTTSYMKYAMNIADLATTQLPSYTAGAGGSTDTSCVDDDDQAKAECVKAGSAADGWVCDCADLQSKSLCADATYGGVVRAACPKACGVCSASTGSVDSYMAVKISPAIKPASDHVVHHMVLYSCTTAAEEAAAQAYTTPKEGKMPCSRVIYAWAVGGGAFCNPPSIAFELKTTKPWYMLEIHYDNPSGAAGIVDDSGLDIVVRNGAAVANYQTAGMMWFAASIPEIKIPPGLPHFEVEATCKFGAESNFQGKATIPSEGVTMYGSMLHGHTLARKIWTEVHRGGTFYESDANCATDYDFDLQETLPFPEQLKVYPNDQFVTHCVYDSTGRTQMTPGGDETENEMCINFVYYYPEQPIEYICYAAGDELKSTTTAPAQNHVCKSDVNGGGGGAVDLCAPPTPPPAPPAGDAECKDDDAGLLAPCRLAAKDHACTCQSLSWGCDETNEDGLMVLPAPVVDMIKSPEPVRTSGAAIRHFCPATCNACDTTDDVGCSVTTVNGHYRSCLSDGYCNSCLANMDTQWGSCLAGSRTLRKLQTCTDEAIPSVECKEQRKECTNHVECDVCLAAIYSQLAALQADTTGSEVYDRESEKPALADIAECSGTAGAKYAEYFSEGACADQPQLTTSTAEEEEDEQEQEQEQEQEEEEEEENTGVVEGEGGNDASAAIEGYVSDVQCTRKRTENKEFRTPDNGVDPLADLLEHTVNCLYNIQSCRSSGYDILADEGVADEDGTRLYYAKYRMDAGLNSQMEALLKNTATEKGFRAKVVGATATASDDINGRAGFILSGGTIEEAGNSGTAAGSFGSFYSSAESENASSKTGLVIGLVAGLTVVLGIPMAFVMLRAQDAAAPAGTTVAKTYADPSNLIEMEAL